MGVYDGKVMQGYDDLINEIVRQSAAEMVQLTAERDRAAALLGDALQRRKDEPWHKLIGHLRDRLARTQEHCRRLAYTAYRRNDAEKRLIREMVSRISRVTSERDRARDTAVRLEAEVAELKDRLMEYERLEHWPEGSQMRHVRDLVVALQVAQAKEQMADEDVTRLEAEVARLRDALAGQESMLAAMQVNVRDRQAQIKNMREMEIRAEDCWVKRITELEQEHARERESRLNADDIRVIVLDAMSQMRRKGESSEICARWISERIRAALFQPTAPKEVYQGPDLSYQDDDVV